MVERKEGAEGRGLAIVMMGQAQSLQRVGEMLEQDTDSDSPGSALYKGKIVAAPILLGLATEIALKAWQCESREGPYDRTHDLIKLFDSLDENTRDRLERGLPEVHLVAKFSRERATIREILFVHRDVFEKWRYMHEMSRGIAQTRALNVALKTIIGVFCQEVEQTRWYAGIEAV